MKYKFMFSCFILGSSLLNGCASITGNTTQDVFIETSTSTKNIISDAICKLSNDKGSWSVKTPDIAIIKKSKKDLNITCQKSGYAIKNTTISSRANANMFGNFLFNAGIGAIVDHNTETAYNYPSSIIITMEQLNK